MHYKQVFWRLYCLFGCLLLCWGCVSVSAATIDAKGNNLSGNWPQYRGNKQLTGLSPLKGNITEPKILWKHFTGARETLLVVDLKGQDSIVALPSTDLDNTGGDLKKYYRQWNHDGPYYNLDQTNHYTKFTSNALQANNYKIGDFLQNFPGLEKIEWSRENDYPVKLYTRKNGEWQVYWQIKSPVNIYNPANRNVIVDDIDGDGHLETAGVWWYNVMIVDLETGKVEQTCRFLDQTAFSGRGYGWFGARDINNDGKRELIILSQVEKHINVLGWQQDKLVKLWGRYMGRYEGYSNENDVLLIPGVNPLEDIDGDGKLEIVFSLYNYNYDTTAIGDGRWHIIALEPMTGALKLDIADNYLSGLIDLDNDGAVEIFATPALGATLRRVGDLKIYSYKNGKLMVRWQSPEPQSFQIQAVNDFPLSETTCASDGWKTILTGRIAKEGRPLFFTQRLPDPGENIVNATVWQADTKGKIEAIACIEAPNLEILAIRPLPNINGGNFLVGVEVPRNTPANIITKLCSVKAVYSRSIGNPMGTPVIGRLTPGYPSTVVVEGAGRLIEAFQPLTDSRTKTLWKISGHGCAGSQGDFDKCVHLADLTGNGELETVFVERAPSGFGRVVAIDPQGSEVWHRDFEGIPWEESGYVTSGMGGFYSGNFTSADHADLLVTVHWGTGHSGYRSYLLNGKNGSEIWNCIEGGAAIRGCGGCWMNVFDYDKDGLDDILYNHHDRIYVLKGVDSSLLFNKCVANMFGPFSSNGRTFVSDFRGNGQIEMQYNIGRQKRPLIEGFVLLDRNGNIVWNNPDAAINNLRPGLGDIDGDGNWELLQVGAGLHPIDAVSGAIEWTLPGVGAYVEPVSADVNSDDMHEAIVATGNTLTVAGYNGIDGGKILWNIKFPDEIGAPAIAEINGTMQIVVVCKDGYIYGIGEQKDLD